MQMIPLFKPYMPQGLPGLDTILNSDALAYGKWGKQFERKLGDYIGNPKIAVVNSYNSAMLVALTVIGIKPGDEIIASPMSCLASNQPFVTQGAKVVWADIDPSTGTLSPDSVKDKITSKTKAIFHNHHCGYIGHFKDINCIAKENGIYVVDDAIEAFGSEINGKRMGNLDSDMTIFSFQTVRLPNTIDGGAIAFNNNEDYLLAQKIRDLGVPRNIFRDKLGEISKHCDIAIPGFGATLSEVNSYIGCMQMEQIDELLKIQKGNANIWKKKLSQEYPEIIQFGRTQHPNFWIFGILSPRKQQDLIDFRSKGFYCSGVHLNNNEYSVFGLQDKLPGVTEFYSKFLALASGWWFQMDNYSL